MQYLPHIKRAEIDRRLAADPAGRKPWPRRPLSRSRCNRCFRIRGNFDRALARVASWAELAAAPENRVDRLPVGPCAEIHYHREEDRSDRVTSPHRAQSTG